MSPKKREYFRKNDLSPVETALDQHTLTLSNFQGKSIYLVKEKKFLNKNDLISLDAKSMTATILTRLAFAGNSSRLDIEITSKNKNKPGGLNLITQDPTRILKIRNLYDPYGPSLDLTNNVILYKKWFKRGAYLDRIYFDKKKITPMFGVIGFFYLALAAFDFGMTELTLLAAGSKRYPNEWGTTIPLIGYYVWPKFGFDTKIKKIRHQPRPSKYCKTVLDVIEMDSEWWEANGNGGNMKFDLSPNSRSWNTLLTYLRKKGLI